MSDIKLNAPEFKVLQDAAFFETKAAIELKLLQHFQELILSIRQLNSLHNLPEELLARPGRHYSGNKFRNHLPWHASDALRAFEGDDLFCFRTVLLWGHHFSFNLVIGGKWLRQFLPSLLAHQTQLANLHFQLSQQAGPWDWNFDAESHQPIENCSILEIRTNSESRNWLKISQKLPLNAFDSLPEEGLATWSALLQILTKND